MPQADDVLRFRQTVSDLSRDLGSDGVEQVLQSFLEDSHGRIGSLGGLLRAGDLAGLGRHAHSLKGSASIFGLDDLGRSAEELEIASRAGGTERLADLVASLQARYAVLEPSLRASASQPRPIEGG